MKEQERHRRMEKQEKEKMEGEGMEWRVFQKER